jgi:hypothetical protein
MIIQMPDLYILGAGCSRNYSEATHGIRGLESPTNGNFFKMARLVIEKTGMKSDSRFMEEIDLLIKTVARLYGGPNDLRLFSKKNLNLEDVMTLLDIESRMFSTLSAQRLGQSESRQLRALKDLLTRTLELALMGPPCSKHRSLVREMTDGDVVLSMNYDILIDNALISSGKTSDSGYNMNFYMVNHDGEWIRPAPPDSRRSQVSLFKLHGSLNWVRCGLCGSLLLYRYRKQTLIGGEPFQCPRCSDTFAERMIIPPLHSKDYRDKDQAFLWIQADRAMKEFSRIVSIGYSFSPLDSDMTALIRRLRTRQTKDPEVDFIGHPHHPDRQAEKRLKDLLGVKKMKCYKGLSSYLESKHS